ncbi:uncharacterized protein LDX57_002521 [Aspergillus melleus]|uniref:uncharacterized protein n=1 Tax=Aspergillus melleus TaxID=138277 RepID=UPI001E8D8F28|nr:uncharacterized protein LDX57_002521 [Aspergillus melleus]KAH8424778.1 hypothetical protein LDX57_002521 [Aspergillus melleus]
MWKNLEDLQTGRSCHQFIRVTDVPVAAFFNLDRLGLGSRLSYNTESQDLEIRLTPSRGHERAHRSFIRQIENKLSALCVPEDDMDPFIAATTYPGHSGYRQADSAILPLPERPGERDPPTLVILCGVSECLNELLREAKWWLTQTQPPVNVVITIRLDLRPRTVIIEVWKLLSCSSDYCSGSSDSLCPRSATEVILTPEGDTNNYRASRGISLQFRDIMPREPPVGGEEIVIPEQDLENWARMIFERMDRR